MKSKAVTVWKHKSCIIAALLGGHALGMFPPAPNAWAEGGSLPMATAQHDGQRLPDFVPLGPSILIGDQEDPIRVILLQRDKSVAANNKVGQLRYAVEPLLNPMICNDGPLPSLPWVQQVENLPDGSVRLMFKFRLSTPRLIEAAREVIEVTEAETIAKAVELNGGQPVNVTVERLPLTRLRMDLAPRFDLSKILAYGEAEVTRSGNNAELWMKVDAGSLAELTELASRKLLSFKPSYSYLNNRMATARLITVADLKIADILNEFLKTHNPSGDGLVSQIEISAFQREVVAQVRSRIIAEDPQAAALLVNNVTQIVGAMFARVEAVPFDQYIKRPGFDRQAMARHLEPHGWVVVNDQAMDQVDEVRFVQRNATGVQGGLGVSVGDPSSGVGVGVDIGVSSMDETIRSTAQKTGILLRKHETKQGYMPSRIELFRTLKQNDGNVWKQSMEVFVGLGSSKGVFDGSAFQQGYDTKVIDQTLLKIFDEFHAQAEKYRAATRGLIAGNQLFVNLDQALADEVLLHKSVFEKSQACRSTALNVAGKVAAVKYYEGLLFGYEHAVELLGPHHSGIDREESAESVGWYGGWKGPKIADGRDKLEAKQAELRTAEAAYNLALADCQAENAKLRGAAGKVDSLVQRLGTMSIQELVSKLYPQHPSRAAEQSIAEATKLLTQHKKQLDELRTLTAKEQKAVADMLETEATTRTITAEIAGPQGLEQWRSGKLDAMRDGCIAYTAHVISAHDELEGRDVRGWFEGTHLNAARGELNAATQAVGALAVRKEAVAAADKQFSELGTSVQGLHGEMRTVMKELKTIHVDLSGFVAELVTAGSTKE